MTEQVYLILVLGRNLQEIDFEWLKNDFVRENSFSAVLGGQKPWRCEHLIGFLSYWNCPVIESGQQKEIKMKQQKKKRSRSPSEKLSEEDITDLAQISAQKK